MLKIFKNVSPTRKDKDIDMESLLFALTNEDVFVPEEQTWEFEFDRQVLQHAIYLNYFLEFKGVDIPIGLVFKPNSTYPGWNLLLDATHVNGSLAVEVSMYFDFTGVENDYILEFEDLIRDRWDGNF